MGRQTFVDTFGGLYERSPWVAERVFDAGLDARHDVPGHLHEAFRKTVLTAGRLTQLALLRAHPQLACGQSSLTGDSLSEQQAAGLQNCSDEELRAFAELNAKYRKRFGFPFIVAVRGKHRKQILAQFRERLQAQPDVEFKTALEQVCLIGKHRLAERYHG